MSNHPLSPMTEAMYYVLLALQEPHHGYAMMDRVSQVSHGRISMGPGTLYGILKRMQKDNYISLKVDDGRRKVYHITPKGELALLREYERLISMVSDGKAILGRNDSDE